MQWLIAAAVRLCHGGRRRGGPIDELIINSTDAAEQRFFKM
jgi:hypothetical protein